MKVSRQALCIGLFLLLGLVLFTTDSGAYPRYKNDNEDPFSNCSACHGDFTGDTSPTGTLFPSDNKHEMHRSSGSMNTECNLCHTNGDGRNPFIGSSQGTAANTGYGCVGCHGRLEDAGGDSISAGYGAGLRQHHDVAGVGLCANCHSDADPANFTPVGENVMPPYYGTGDTMANMPCNPQPSADVNENWSVGDLQGLDNDGDFVYDTNDDGCLAVVECPDDDGDGFAVCDATCELAAGDQCGDCNDTEATVNPDGVEGPAGDATCGDGLDNDCDELIDDADTDCEPVVVFCPDEDVDGFVVCDGVCEVPAGAQCGDCDDTNAAVNPGATEGPAGDATCGDGLDNDCDGAVDEADAGCEPVIVLCPDADGDGYAVCDAGCELAAGDQCGDCDDTSAAVNPGATEGPAGDATCGDGLDNDCDGTVDEADAGCEPVIVLCPDADGDGYAVCDAGCELAAGDQCDDCDDTDFFVNPGASEGPFMDATCGDGLDNDCDGFADGEDSACMEPTMSDYDIVSFHCSRNARVGKRISLRVAVENQGLSDPGALLTVYGMREDGSMIPIAMDLAIFDAPGNGRSRSRFTYTATTVDVGTILWNAELTDEMPGAEDQAQDTTTCMTTVRAGNQGHPRPRSQRRAASSTGPGRLQPRK